MGCDIHVVVEQKYGDEWVGVHDCPAVRSRSIDGTLQYSWHDIEDRNYRRFAMLAGVRGKGPAARGVPADMSTLATHRVEAWRGDGHNHSWTTVYELIPIMLETSHIEDREALAKELLTGPRAAAEYVMYRWLGVEGVDPERVRIVYWFDN